MSGRLKSESANVGAYASFNLHRLRRGRSCAAIREHSPSRCSPFASRSSPVRQSAQIYYAKELGFFAKNGLDATITEVRNGAASAAAIAGGAVDIGFSNGLSIAQGHERGIDFTVLAPAALSVAGKGTNAILVVGKTSPIRSGKDLNGKTVAIDVVGGFPQIAVRTWIDKNGGRFQHGEVHRVRLSGNDSGREYRPRRCRRDQHGVRPIARQAQRPGPHAPAAPMMRCRRASRRRSGLR